MARLFLLLASFITIGVGLGYGAAPYSMLPLVMDFTMTVDIAHVFRAVMMLYIAISLFWAYAAFQPSLQRFAIWSQILFMGSLASGRLISIALDGFPSFLLGFYTISEIGMALAGFIVLRMSAEGPTRT